MAALHEQESAPSIEDGRHLECIGRLNTLFPVELEGETVRDVEEVRLPLTPLKSYLPYGGGTGGEAGSDWRLRISPQLRQLTRRNEILVGIACNRQLFADIGRVAQLRELADDVLALRLLRQLQFDIHRRCGQQRIVGSIENLQRHTVRRSIEHHSDWNLPLGSLSRHEPFEDNIVVAIESHARPERLGHPQREQAVAFSPIHAKAHEFRLSPLSSLIILLKEAQPVAVGKGCGACHRERIAAHLLHLAHIFAQRLRRVERRDVALPALQDSVFVAMSMQEVVGEPAVERLAQVGFEGIGNTSARSPLEVVGTPTDQVIESLAIGSYHVLHVGDVLQPAFYLERHSTRVGEFLQRIDAAHVLQRQQVTLMLNLAAVGIEEVVLHAAHLRTLATIGRAAQTELRHIALSAVAHAQRSMHEHLKFHIRHPAMNLANLLQRQLASEHDPAETQRPEPRHLLGCAVIGLGGSMKKPPPTSPRRGGFFDER